MPARFRTTLALAARLALVEFLSTILTLWLPFVPYVLIRGVVAFVVKRALGGFARRQPGRERRLPERKPSVLVTVAVRIALVVISIVTP